MIFPTILENLSPLMVFLVRVFSHPPSQESLGEWHPARLDSRRALGVGTCASKPFNLVSLGSLLCYNEGLPAGFLFQFTPDQLILGVPTTVLVWESSPFRNRVSLIPVAGPLGPTSALIVNQLNKTILMPVAHLSRVFPPYFRAFLCYQLTFWYIRDWSDRSSALGGR